MKFKKDLILLGIMILVTVCASEITILCHHNGIKKEEKIQIMASFYPMYIIALNLAEGIDNVDITCLTQNQTGCLHDYQMTTKDMKTLEQADVFIINGGGMETFLENAVQNYPSLAIINAGKSLEQFMESEHSYTDNEWEENKNHREDMEDMEEEDNAHFWLNPKYYMIQIQTIAEELAKLDKSHKKQYQKNAEKYIERVQKIDEQMSAELTLPSFPVIVFHDAFVYLADYLGLRVVHTVEMDGETALSAGEIAEIIEEVREEQVSVLFTEAQYSTEIADTIGKETGAVPYIMDSLVTGNGDRDSYVRGMESNFEVLKKAFLQ